MQVHDLNFPRVSRSLRCADIDPVQDIPAGPVEAAWFSPDCRHFSDAKNAKPLDKRIRGLAWIALRVAAKRRPGVIFLENVPGFLKWGRSADRTDRSEEAGRDLRSLRLAAP